MKPTGDVKKENDVCNKASEAAQEVANDVNAAPIVSGEPIDFSKVEIEPLFADFDDFDTFAKSDFRAVKVKECEAVKKSKKLLKFTLDDGTGVDRVILSGIRDTYEPEELVGKTLIAITNLSPRKMMGIDSCGMIISAVHHEEGIEKLHCLTVLTEACSDCRMMESAIEMICWFLQACFPHTFLVFKSSRFCIPADQSKLK